MTVNPGCLRRCHLDRMSELGFVVEPGCEIHDQAARQIFRVSWVNGKPWCIGSLALVEPASGTHIHTMFAMGLN